MSSGSRNDLQQLGANLRGRLVRPEDADYNDARISYKSFSGDAAENYQEYFVPTIGRAFGDVLLGVTSLGPGERVLDVACGTGVVTRLAADAVGETGSVTGLDLNTGMLAVARNASASCGIAWHQGSAEAMPLPDQAFDAVTCSLGLQFMADQPGALREMHRVLVHGGRVAIATVRPNPFFAVFEEALARHISPEVAGFMAQVFSLGAATALQRLLSDAGFREVTVKAEHLTIQLPPPVAFLWQYVNLTPLRAVVAELDETVREALERDVVSGWGPFVRDGTLTFAVDAVLSTGRK